MAAERRMPVHCEHLKRTRDNRYFCAAVKKRMPALCMLIEDKTARHACYEYARKPRKKAKAKRKIKRKR